MPSLRASFGCDWTRAEGACYVAGDLRRLGGSPSSDGPSADGLAPTNPRWAGLLGKTWKSTC